MLDLDARVHLDEIEILRTTAVVVQELQRAGAAIAHRARQLRGRFAQALARGGVQRGRGRFLEHLLATPLQRAFAFIQMDGVLAVSQHLHFDARAGSVPGRPRHSRTPPAPRPGLRHLRAQLGLVLHHADAAPAAAGRRLDHQRIAHARGMRQRFIERGHHAFATGHGGHAGRLGARGGLVAHFPYGLGIRADEDQARVADGLREGGVLGQKAVAGMHGLGAGFARGLQHGVHVQVAARGVGRADVHGLVRHARGQRVAVGVAVDRHAAHAEFAGGANHAQGDLATVGHQQLVNAARAVGRVNHGHGTLTP